MLGFTSHSAPGFLECSWSISALPVALPDIYICRGERTNNRLSKPRPPRHPSQLASHPSHPSTRSWGRRGSHNNSSKVTESTNEGALLVAKRWSAATARLLVVQRNRPNSFQHIRRCLYRVSELQMLRYCLRSGAGVARAARGLSYAVRYSEHGEPLNVLQ